MNTRNMSKFDLQQSAYHHGCLHGESDPKGLYGPSSVRARDIFGSRYDDGLFESYAAGYRKSSVEAAKREGLSL